MMFKTIVFPFAYTYCISLVRSVDRRRWIKDEFKKNKIADFKFIDAVNEDDHIVEDAYEHGMVKLFPPCFRCGKEDCNCDNNVLIKTQVATFFSHMQAWEIIANKKSGMYLIVEDDIKFNWYYRFMKYSFHKKINDFVKERSHKPLLIRLAWANNEEHKLQRPKFVASLVRMSNPMYSINPEMAKVLLEEFKTIDTTVDLYVHKYIGKKYDNYTLMPPLAHELSYSHGKVESLVRPRLKRIEELQKRNDACSKKELSRYDIHIDKAIKRKLLVIGYPMVGYDYISELLKVYGLDVGLEKVGADGIVSWMFAVYDLNNPCYFDKYAKSRYFVSFENTIIFVQDPYTAIPGIIRENSVPDVSYKFIEKHIKKNYGVNINEIENDFKKAIETYYFWSKLTIEKNKPSLIVRVEKDEAILLEYLKTNNFDIKIDADKLPEISIKSNIGYKEKPIGESQIVFDNWLELDDLWKVKLNELCVMLNYNPIFNDSLLAVDR